MENRGPGSQQLLSASNSSHLRDESIPISADHSFQVIYGKASGEAVIRADGSFEYCPRSKPPDATSPCCLPKPGTVPFQIEGSDIVGAVSRGMNSFSIWYCPSNRRSGRHLRRKLQVTSSFECNNQKDADEAVELLRSLNSWWGKSKPPHIFIFVNPVSGSGKSRSVWKRTCQPIFAAAGLSLEVVETQRSQHAFGIAKNADLRGAAALGCVGGDGTMSEILQGLFARNDWKEAIKVPLCILPTGTGNGLSASSGMWTPTLAAHALCKGSVRALDVISILQPPREPLYSFLSTTFGFIANVDIGTENLRFLGLLRNQVGAVKEILKGGHYQANVAIVTRQAASGLKISADTESQSRPATPLLDSLGDLNSLGPLQCANLPRAQGWKLLDRTDYSLLTISNVSHLALDFSLVPTEQVDSGEMTLTSLPGNVSRWEGVQAMLKADAGKIEEAKHVQSEKIAAFILEPNSSGTWLVMDGEVLPYERMFAELLPGLCKVIVAA